MEKGVCVAQQKPPRGSSCCCCGFTDRVVVRGRPRHSYAQAMATLGSSKAVEQHVCYEGTGERGAKEGSSGRLHICQRLAERQNGMRDSKVGAGRRRLGGRWCRVHMPHAVMKRHACDSRQARACCCCAGYRLGPTQAIESESESACSMRLWKAVCRSNSAGASRACRLYPL